MFKLSALLYDLIYINNWAAPLPSTAQTVLNESVLGQPDARHKVSQIIHHTLLDGFSLIQLHLSIPEYSAGNLQLHPVCEVSSFEFNSMNKYPTSQVH